MEKEIIYSFSGIFVSVVLLFYFNLQFWFYSWFIFVFKERVKVGIEDLRFYWFALSIHTRSKNFSILHSSLAYKLAHTLPDRLQSDFKIKKTTVSKKVRKLFCCFDLKWSLENLQYRKLSGGWKF